MRLHGWILGNLFKKFFDAAFKLRIASLENSFWLLPDFNVRINAVTFDDVFARLAIRRAKRYENDSSVS